MKGIDVSNHQGNINWSAVKGSGVEVAYIKATEGDYFKDKYAVNNYNNAKAQGIKVGFYHFLNGNSGGRTQAEYFYNFLKENNLLNYDCKLCLDVEVAVGSVANVSIDFCNRLKELTGQDILIYTGPYFSNAHLDNRLSSYPCWIAHYGVDRPMATNIWGNNYAGHQYSSSGSVPGVNGNCDMDNFTDAILLNNSASVQTQPASTPGPIEDTPQNPKWRNVYDPQIAELQRILNAKGHNLKVDGYIGPKTYGAVKGYTINLGDRGPLTKWVQDRLNTMQYNAGYADGYAEQPTMDGIARFQRSYGLGVGYLGGTDWYYLTNR